MAAAVLLLLETLVEYPLVWIVSLKGISKVNLRASGQVVPLSPTHCHPFHHHNLTSPSLNTPYQPSIYPPSSLESSRGIEGKESKKGSGV